jgi:hypothetical protein
MAKYPFNIPCTYRPKRKIREAPPRRCARGLGLCYCYVLGNADRRRIGDGWLRAFSLDYVRACSGIVIWRVWRNSNLA